MGPSAGLAGGWMHARATERGRAMLFPMIPPTREAVWAHDVGKPVRTRPSDAVRIARSGLPTGPRKET